MNKKIKILLLKNIRKLGKIGSEVFVKKGFAYNYLFPQNLACYYSEDKKKSLNIQKEENNKQYEDLYNKINNQTIDIHFKIGNLGKLYEKVKKNQVLSVLNEQFEINLHEKQINLGTVPIKQIGTYNIEIELNYNYIASIILNIKEL